MSFESLGLAPFLLRALAEDTLDVEKIELVTDGERCPVYYIELK